MANLHRGMCLECESYRVGLRKALGLISEIQEDLLLLLAKAPAHRIDEFLEASVHERETQPEIRNQPRPKGRSFRRHVETYATVSWVAGRAIPKPHQAAPSDSHGVQIVGATPSPR
jgi:hypothetical protein